MSNIVKSSRLVAIVAYVLSASFHSNGQTVPSADKTVISVAMLYWGDRILNEISDIATSEPCLEVPSSRGVDSHQKRERAQQKIIVAIEFERSVEKREFSPSVSSSIKNCVARLPPLPSANTDERDYFDWAYKRRLEGPELEINHYIYQLKISRDRKLRARFLLASIAAMIDAHAADHCYMKNDRDNNEREAMARVMATWNAPEPLNQPYRLLDESISIDNTTAASENISSWLEEDCEFGDHMSTVVQEGRLNGQLNSASRTRMAIAGQRIAQIVYQSLSLSR